MMNIGCGRLGFWLVGIKRSLFCCCRPFLRWGCCITHILLFLGQSWFCRRDCSFSGRDVFSWSFLEIALAVCVVETEQFFSLARILAHNFLPFIHSDDWCLSELDISHVPQINFLGLLTQHLIIATGYIPQQSHPIIAQLVPPLYLMYMISYLTQRIFNTHPIHHLTIKDIQHWFHFSIDFVIEILFVYVAVVTFLLEETHLLFDTVYLLDYFLDVYVLDFLFDFLLSLLWDLKILEILSTYIFVVSGLATLIFTHIVLLHLLQQLQVLRLGNFLIPHTHMSIHRGNPAHRKIGNILEVDIILINLKFLLLQKVEVEQLPLLLVVYVIMLDIFILIIFRFHLIVIFYCVLHYISTRYPYISEVVDW